MIDKPEIRSVRSLLDYTYTVLIDGHIGVSGLIEVKKALDDAVKKAHPIRAEWGMDAEELDEIPSAFDTAADPARGAHRSEGGGGLG